jgi:hypothetical protein
MGEMSYTERAKRGAILLDGLKPGWYEMVDLETLRMDSLLDCILGQVYGDWGYGAAEVGLNYDRSGQERHGFELTVEECTSNLGQAKEGLHNAWAAEVLDRMA